MRITLLLFVCTISYSSISAQISENIKEEVWRMELKYWHYVEKNDTAAYNALWHKNFIGYPDSDSLTGKDRIAGWITDVHNKKDLHYEFLLHKKLVNPFDDVVITFYDETDIWKDDKNEVASKEVYKITHTWKKFGDSWLIIGGMSALKNR